MCNLSSAIERKGIAIGEARGRAEGEARGDFKATVRYYRRGMLTAGDAASDLGMSVDEFLEKAEQLGQNQSAKK